MTHHRNSKVCKLSIYLFLNYEKRLHQCALSRSLTFLGMFGVNLQKKKYSSRKKTQKKRIIIFKN